jgi:lysozyme
MATAVSPQGADFTGRREGFVSKTYRDPGGVLTIGHGFTSLSKVFSEYWQRTRGRKLRMGDVISKAESLQVLETLLNKEYAPPVAKRFGGGLKQHEFDACADMTYNCGAGTLKDQWATYVAEGRIAQAAARLLKTRVTAGGKFLAGLVNRRRAQANLLQYANYGTGTATSTGVAEVKEYQEQLAKLGYYKGPIDGIAGRGTRDAVMAFQLDKNLEVDGLVGPATRSALRNALDNKVATKAVAGSAGTAGSADVAINLPPLPDTTTPPSSIDPSGIPTDLLIQAGVVALIVGGLVLVGFLIWKNRGRILRKRTPA